MGETASQVSLFEQARSISEQVLKVEIKPGDDFFELGGTSLDAVELVTRLEELIGHEIGIDSLWDSDTFLEFLETIAG